MKEYNKLVRDLIPENRSGQFQGVRILGQVFIPGLIGPFIGSTVLKNAEQILNNDGTYSFLPNKNIWLASLIVIIVLSIVLNLIKNKVNNNE